MILSRGPRPLKLTETSLPSSLSLAGTWSNYRFKGGKSVASAIENAANGMFVLRPSTELKRP